MDYQPKPKTLACPMCSQPTAYAGLCATCDQDAATVAQYSEQMQELYGDTWEGVAF